jgi:chromosome segregation ATPase
MAALLALWSFLTSRFGILIVACLLAFGSGYSLANRKADLDRKNAEIATLKADQATAENARSLAERQAADLDTKLRDNQARVDALQADLEARQRQPTPAQARTITHVVTKLVNRPAAARDCGLSEADLKRLKEIR